MINKVKLLIIVVLSLFILDSMSASDKKLAEIRKRYPIERQIRYSYTIRNSERELEEKVEFWTYAPVKQTSSQYCLSIEASEPYRLINDEAGNQILHFTLEDMPAFSTRIINIKVNLLLSPKSNTLGLDDKESYLKEERYVESDHKSIKELASKLGGRKKMENIFNWVSANIRDSGFQPDDRGALYALINKSGDSTEYMSLFVALSRASKVPARGVSGYIAGANMILYPAAFHNWAEYYHKGAWHTADPFKRVFIKGQEDYIAFRIVTGDKSPPMKGAHRFRVAPEYVKVRIE